MARKNSLVYHVLSAQSMGASFTSSPTLVKNLDNCSYQIHFTTSDAVGTFSVEASVDYAIDETVNKVTNTGNWIPLQLSGGTPTAASANDDILINLNQVPFNAIRLKYTRVSGTGTADVYIMARQLGG